MKLYEPDYSIAENVPEERTLASCGDRDVNIASIMREMDFSDEISRGAERIYRDGLGFSNVLAFVVHAYTSYRSTTKSPKVNADTSEI